MMISMTTNSFNPWDLEQEKEECQKINKFMGIFIKLTNKSHKKYRNQSDSKNQPIAILNQVLQFKTTQQNVRFTFLR